MIGKFPSVLLLGTQMTRAGSQHALLRLGQGLHQRGWQAEAAFLYDKDGLQEEWQRQTGIPVHNLNAWLKNGGLGNGFRLMGGMLRLLTLLRREKFDLIMTYTQHSNLVAIPLAWLAGVPLRIASNRGCIDGMPGWLSCLHGALVNRLAACLVANSQHVRDEAIALDGVRAERIVVIPNGVPLPPEVDHRDTRSQVRAEFGLTAETPILITVGRLTRQKGHVFLIQSMPAILQKHPETHLFLIGDGELRRPLSALAHELGVQAAVHFLGMRPDVQRLLGAADVFVFPTLWEGMPNALLEAMALGIPAAASSIPETGEILVHEENGLLFPAEDAPGCAAAVLRLLDDGGLRRRLGAAGRVFVAEHFSVERMIANYADLFTRYYYDVTREPA